MLRLALHAMGTRFEFAVFGDRATAHRPAGELALEEIRLWHERLSRYQPDSWVRFAEREGPHRDLPVDGDLFDLLTLCRDVWLASGGAFDPAVAPAMSRLGFGPPPAGATPTGADDQPPFTFADVILDERARTVRIARPGVMLDFGAVAKGFALDQAAAILRSHGVTHALLHGGTSSIVAIGPPPGERPFHIDIESAAGAPVRVHLRDRAMSVSAPRGRVAHDDQGQPHTHILDPRTGRPPTGRPCHTAAALATSAALADAWTTALVVLAARPPAAPPELTTALELDAGWSAQGPASAAFSSTTPSPATTEAA